MNRLHDIADARIEIAEALATPVMVVRRNQCGLARRAIPVTIALAALALLVAIVWWRPLFRPSPTPSSAQALEFGITFPNNFMNANGVVISPDGRQIAANVWSNWGDISDRFARRIATSSPSRRRASGLSVLVPGQFHDRVLHCLAAGHDECHGGPRTSIATVAGASGGSWSRAGVILYAARAKLFQVSASGGGPPLKSVSPASPGRSVVRDSCQTADTSSSALNNRGEALSAWLRSMAIPSGFLGESECPGGFAPPDHVLFVRGASLLAQKLDLRRFALEGEVKVVASGVTRGAVRPMAEIAIVRL